MKKKRIDPEPERAERWQRAQATRAATKPGKTVSWAQLEALLHRQVERTT